MMMTTLLLLLHLGKRKHQAWLASSLRRWSTLPPVLVPPRQQVLLVLQSLQLPCFASCSSYSFCCSAALVLLLVLQVVLLGQVVLVSEVQEQLLVFQLASPPLLVLGVQKQEELVCLLISSTSCHSWTSLQRILGKEVKQVVEVGQLPQALVQPQLEQVQVPSQWLPCHSSFPF
jgi:hypothetical protein